MSTLQPKVLNNKRERNIIYSKIPGGSLNLFLQVHTKPRNAILTITPRSLTKTKSSPNPPKNKRAPRKTNINFQNPFSEVLFKNNFAASISLAPFTSSLYKLIFYKEAMYIYTYLLIRSNEYWISSVIAKD